MMLKERVREAMESCGLSPADLARATKSTNAAVGFWLTGETKSLKAEKAQLLEIATGYRAMWLITGKGPKKTSEEGGRQPRSAIELDGNPEYPAIRRVSIKAQAGVTGYAVDYMNDDGPPIVFRRDWYAANNYLPEKMMALRVSGESMSPSLYAGDLIILNSLQTEPKDGIVFVCIYEGEVVVKRLLRDTGQWWLSSDNQDQRRFPRKACDQSTEIVGEVVYRQTERI